jgi:hypothetical protein
MINCGNILGPYLPGTGNVSSNGTQSKEYTFTADIQGRTQYDLSAAPHNVDVQPNNVDVHVNEIKLVGAEKPSLNGFVVTLANAAIKGSIITIRTY